MNDMQIYEQVAKKPRIGAAEIATNLDLTLTTVSSDLRVLVAAGDLVKSPKFDGNGRQRMAYEFSDEFKASRTYQALMDSMGAPAAAAPGTSGSAQEDDAPAAPPAPSTSMDRRTGPRSGPTKVQLAIDCITKLGGATNDQLRDAMNLPAGSHPSSYLRSAIETKRVVWDCERWRLFAAAPEMREPAPKATAPAEQAKEPIEIPRFDKVVPPAPVDAHAVAPKPSRCRTAVWSDGGVEIKVPGMPALELTRAEFDEIARFVNGARA